MADEIEPILERLAKLRERIEQPEVQEELAALEKELRAYASERERLIEELRAAAGEEPPVSRVAPADLARSFTDVIQKIQSEAREAEYVGVTIKAMDVEVKGLVEVEEERTALVLPAAAAAIDPALLSTLRVSFGAIPTVPREEPPAEERERER